MPKQNVQPPVNGWFPDPPSDDEPTARHPEVQQLVDEFDAIFPKEA